MRNPPWKALPETRLKRNWRLPVFCGSLRTGSKPSPMPSSLQQFKCPGCGTPFSAADVDNRRDTVTCSSCGLSTPWTSLVREHEFHDVPAAPSRHLTVTSAHGKVTLTYRHSFIQNTLYTGLAVVWGIITLVLVLLSFGRGKRTSRCPSSPPSLPSRKPSSSSSALT